jgi:hypothetical protein
MSGKILIPLFAAAFLLAPAFTPAAGVPDSATAATTVKSSRPNTETTTLRMAEIMIPGNAGDRMGGGGGKGHARTTTVKSSKSNTSDRMGGGGGGKGAAGRATTVKSSKSNTSDRMGGGGGKGAAGQ